MKSKIDEKRVKRRSKMGSKCLFSTIVFTKHLIMVQNLVFSEKHRSRRQIGRYILSFSAIGVDLLVQKCFFGS